eukprot:CAMPEP_0195528964 /NCGR_PEP_ID=MMETSP0794_2-20130614/31341_1 /TAXON_ID=515487 /ORGANISM="Stephanopyxis turris, Strain CCMP 815" /LENGTH=221 /DNA_ID=CAMNT_0040660193 /DNA_START=38 /DNA_END=703 /DNA_ORIENTATION=-
MAMASRALHLHRRINGAAAITCAISRIFRNPPPSMCSKQIFLLQGVCDNLDRRAFVTITKTSSSTIPQPVHEEEASTSITPSQSENLSSPQTDDVVVLNITPSCTDRIKQLASKRPNPEKQCHLRVYVDAGGCSGFQYKFELEDHDEDTFDELEDFLFENHDAKVVVDKESLDLIRGSTIDYVREMIRSSFVVAGNPLSESACGCGSSFAIKNFAANPATD